MKTNNIFKKAFFLPVLIIVTALFIASCSKSDNNNNNGTAMYTISGNASGSQETPPTSSTGTATLTGTYNSSTNQLVYTISWTGLTALVTAAHFHGPAGVGVSANPLIDLTITSNGLAGTASATLTLPDSTETFLLNGNLYYNLHTPTYPTGEIRGQVMATAQ